MRTNYVLIDYENVQPKSLTGLEGDCFKVLLFCGENQARVPFEIVEVMQRLGSRAEYVKISGTGSNALDFHIAYYIGQLAVKDPTAYFHIVSKDKGFDPLLKHLKANKVSANRIERIEDIPLVKAAAAKTLPEWIQIAKSNLEQRNGNRPAKLKTLTSSLSNLFQNRLSEKEQAALIAGLTKGKIVKVDGNNNITYPLFENVGLVKAGS